ncbi:acetylcholine receptor subunit delta [Caerostris darwini]|uniref:Acetylcholine receptor subunit delta n=1 Tax=Caerostris darwini TaxID=1538125 RepID=A0AAV4RK13_9ARAC|nr:acetylcholine receptor subunit delta [Caerostris darwini]
MHALYSRLIAGDMLIKADEEDADTIRQKLLTDYDPTLSPVMFAGGESHKTLTSLTALRIRGFDEARGEFTLEGVTHFVWTDVRLSWENGQPTYFRVASNEIWVPHVRILNGTSLKTSKALGLSPSLRRYIEWIPHKIVLRQRDFFPSHSIPLAILHWALTPGNSCSLSSSYFSSFIKTFRRHLTYVGHLGQSITNKVH